MPRALGQQIQCRGWRARWSPSAGAGAEHARAARCADRASAHRAAARSSPVGSRREQPVEGRQGGVRVGDDGSAPRAPARRRPGSASGGSTNPQPGSAGRLGKPSRASRALALLPRPDVTVVTLSTAPAGPPGSSDHRRRTRRRPGARSRPALRSRPRPRPARSSRPTAGGDEQRAVLAGPGRDDLRGDLRVELHPPGRGPTPERLVPICGRVASSTAPGGSRSISS